MNSTRRPYSQVLQLKDADALPSGNHRVGNIVGICTDQRQFLVDYPGNAGGPAPSLSTVQVDEATAAKFVKDRQPVLICLDAGQCPPMPIVVGIIQDGIAPAATAKAVRERASKEALVLEHDQRIELRCGETVLILTRDGKLLTRAAYISAYSSGAYRVRGASVEIN